MNVLIASANRPSILTFRSSYICRGRPRAGQLSKCSMPVAVILQKTRRLSDRFRRELTGYPSHGQSLYPCGPWRI